MAQPYATARRRLDLVLEGDTLKPAVARWYDAVGGTQINDP